MRNLLSVAAALGFLTTLGLTAGQAQAASAEEVKICKETISEMTGGKPPAAAVKLCEEGKLNRGDCSPWRSAP